MKTLRLLAIAVAWLAVANAFGQADLQIVDPSCTQYSGPTGTECAPCGCTWTTDAINQFPCGTLSFGNVEAGLTKTLVVKLANNAPVGSVGNLQVTVQLVPTALADNRSYWQILASADVTDLGTGIFQVTAIPPTSPVTIRDVMIKFKPDLASAATGSLPVLLKITSSNSNLCYLDIDDTNNSPGNKLDVLVSLSGTATRTPIHYVMVLDRSGSMGQTVPPSSTKRIDLLKTASNYFVDLLGSRNNPLDRLGIIKFDNQVDPPLLDLGVISPGSTQTLINTLSPGGSTATGPALQRADILVGPAPANGKNVMILYTDGEENVGPPWMMANSPVVSFVNSPYVSTIGMGSLVTSPFQMNLHQFATNHGGEYYYVQEGIATNTTLQTELHKTYLSIYNDVTGMQAVVDPNYQVALGTQEKAVSSAAITSSDRNALFTVFDKTENRKYYDIEIRSPKGEIVINGSLGSGIVGRIISGYDYVIYSVDFSSAKNDLAFVGKWYLVLKPKNIPTEKSKFIVLPIGFAASVFSDLKMSARLGAINSSPGNEIKIALDFTESDLAISGVKDILLRLTTPLGAQIDLKAIKDPFGKWVGQYPYTFDAGTYSVFVRTALQNSKGEWTTREQTKYIALSYPSPGLSGEPCLPCLWIKTFIFIGIALLVILLIFIWKRKKG